MRGQLIPIINYDTPDQQLGSMDFPNFGNICQSKVSEEI